MHWNTAFLTAPNPYAALRRDFDRNVGVNTESSFGAMTVLESRDCWTVAVDVPGAALEDIDVTLTDGLLVIEGQRKSRSDDSSKEVFNDRTFAKFRRELRVREGVDQNRIEADLKDGVLTLHLYRSPESGPQKISIRSAVT